MIQKRPRCSFAASRVGVDAIPVAPEMTREKHLKKKNVTDCFNIIQTPKTRKKKKISETGN